MKHVTINYKVMKHYTDRASKNFYKDIADKCVKGIIVLYDDFEIDLSQYTNNLFLTKFVGEDTFLKKEYLFAMDYLSNVLTTYKETRMEVYKETFERIIEQFLIYTKKEDIFFEDLPIFTQILLLIKAKDILGYFPGEKEWLNLLEVYSEWLMDDCNYYFDNNHGIFSDLALLHLSIFLMEHPESESWKAHAINRINQLFKAAYHDDYTNNEHSIVYFRHNNIMYKYVIDFCNYYGITGIENIENGIIKAEEVLTTIAHSDGSYPIIGDGKVIYGDKSNKESKIFPDMGLAVIKKEELYFSLKAKTVWQAHAHIDIGSITARYKNVDFIIDCGQYNYDRFAPINRFLRSSAGHSGFYPLFADKLFQKEVSELTKDYGRIDYDRIGTTVFIKNQFVLKDVLIKREFFINENDIEIVDCWKAEKPTTMRQRFVLPQYLIKNSRFSASEKRLEVYVDNIKIIFESFVSIENSVTEVNFGVMSSKLNEYETTMLFDTYIENEKEGKIVTKIHIVESD